MVIGENVVYGDDSKTRDGRLLKVGQLFLAPNLQGG